MSHSEEKAKRRWWRPRFSLRTLAILVTLLCVYIGAWGPTKRFASNYGQEVIAADGRLIWRTGLSDDDDAITHDMYHKKLSVVSAHAFTSPAPLILVRRETTSDFKTEKVSRDKRCYYFWLFGAKFKIPFESDWVEAPAA